MIVFTCDNRDDAPNDGQVELVGMLPGTYVLVHQGWPIGYFPDEDIVITIANGQTLEHTFTSTPATVVTALTTDGNEQPLPGACFYLHHDAGGGVPGFQVWGYQLCDDAGSGGDGHHNHPPAPAG